MGKRIIPVLTLLNNDLVKTINYTNPIYLGDPINTMKIFNNKNIDEVAILDITPRFKKNHNLNIGLLSKIAKEAFFPLAYGGNITSYIDAKKIIDIGFEKIIINSLFFTNFDNINEMVFKLGSQSVVLKVDYVLYKNNYHFYSMGKILHKIIINEFINKVTKANVGELILSRVDYDGKMCGFDIDFGLKIKDYLKIPLVLCNGAKDINSIFDAEKYKFSNFAASSIFVFLGNLKAVLINNPFDV